MNKKIQILMAMLLVISTLSVGCGSTEQFEASDSVQETVSVEEVVGEEAEEFAGEPYVVVNDNVPEFPEEDLTEESFEEYSSLDELGRCGAAYANVSEETMPTEERGSIGQVKPSGWQTVKYDNVDGKYLYNRCHLIGFQLTAENANEENLITGTRYLNIDGMLPFENMVADYIRETGNHVLYRVTPIFEGDNLVASGVQMEAESVEDAGEGILFNVYCYNAQPGIEINYEDGDSQEAEIQNISSKTEKFILNVNTKKFHTSSCASVENMEKSNRETFTGNRAELTAQGYEPCKRCNP